MTKNFKTVEASIVMGILLASVFTAIVPTTSAGILVNLSSYVDVSWGGNETTKPIVPRGEMRQLTLNLRYGVNRGALPSQLLFMLYQGRQVNIKLETLETPTWCTATLKSGTITTVVSSEEKELSTVLTLRVDENAPAFGAGYVKIKASVYKIGAIDGYSQEFTLEFTPAYLPMINAQLPDGNTKNIGPMDTAVFPIEISNMGNARTTVFFKIENVPKDWIAVVTDEITLDEGKGSKGIAYLTIKPPKGFGYHYDEQSIIVTMTPARAEDLTNQGESKTVTVIVESRGFSTPGFESVLFIGALLAVVVLLMMARRIKKK